jgi:hypothetical protein
VTRRKEVPVKEQQPSTTTVDLAAKPDNVEQEVAYLAKRHRVSPAIVREILRRIGSVERSAVEREIRNGKMRR